MDAFRTRTPKRRRGRDAMHDAMKIIISCMTNRKGRKEPVRSPDSVLLTQKRSTSTPECHSISPSLVSFQTPTPPPLKRSERNHGENQLKQPIQRALFAEPLDQYAEEWAEDGDFGDLDWNTPEPDVPRESTLPQMKMDPILRKWTGNEDQFVEFSKQVDYSAPPKDVDPRDNSIFNVSNALRSQWEADALFHNSFFPRPHSQVAPADIRPFAPLFSKLRSHASTCD